MRRVSSHAALQEVSAPSDDVGARLGTILCVPATDDAGSWAHRIPHELPAYECFIEGDPDDEQLVSRLGEATVLDKPLALFISPVRAGVARRLAVAAKEGGLCLVQIVVVRDGGDSATVAAAFEGLNVPFMFVEDLTGSPGSPSAKKTFGMLDDALSTEIASAFDEARTTFRTHNLGRLRGDSYPWRKLLAKALTDYGDKEALVDDDTVLSLRDAYERAQTYADIFQERGCAAKDGRRVVGIFLPW